MKITVCQWRWPQQRLAQKFCAVFMALAVALQAVAGPALAQQGRTPANNDGAPVVEPIPAGLERADCRVDDETAFQTRITALVEQSFAASLAAVNYQQLVADQWRDNGVDRTLDTLITSASQETRARSAWSDLISSLASREKAKEIADDMAVRVYRSDVFKQAVTKLVEDASGELAGTVELATLDAAEPTLACVREFVGGQYGRGLARILSQQTAMAFDPKLAGYNPEVSRGQVVLAGSEAIAGALVLLVRRTMINMARRVGQRIVGAILARAVAVVAGGIGVVLIAKDLWELRNGVLPIIEEEMRSEKAAEAVREEIAASLKTQMDSQARVFAVEVTERIMELWRSFQVAHAKVIELTGVLPEFRAFVERLDAPALSRLDRVVAVTLEEGGEPAVRRSIKTGLLQRAVNELPLAGLDIAAETNSLSQAFAWAELAQDRLRDVAVAQVHRAVSPGDISRTELFSLLDLADPDTITQLLKLSPADRRTLLQMDADVVPLPDLARLLTAPQLQNLAGYLRAVSPEARTGLLLELKRRPERMSVLSQTGVRSAVLRSGSQSEALGMAFTPVDGFVPLTFLGHVQSTLTGRVDPYLLWIKHPVAVSVLLVAALLVLLVVWRLLFGGGGRRRARNDGANA